MEEILTLTSTVSTPTPLPKYLHMSTTILRQGGGVAISSSHLNTRPLEFDQIRFLGPIKTLIIGRKNIPLLCRSKINNANKDTHLEC